MRKAVRVMCGLVLAATLAAPASGGATSYEDQLGDCSYPKMFDLMFLRPVSIATLAVGTVLFVPAAAIALLTVPDETGTVFSSFIGKPAAYTFGRPLGECPAQDGL
jgi:hypothetical protein